jgi:hypothetical protein
VLLKNSPEDRFQTFLEIHSLRIQIDRSLSCFISFYEARASYEEKKKGLKEKEIYCLDFGNKISLVFPPLFFYNNNAVQVSFIFKQLLVSNSSTLDGAKIGIFCTNGIFH